MDRTQDPNPSMDREDHMDPGLQDADLDANDAAGGPDWNRRQYVGEGQGDPAGPVADPTDRTANRTWDSDEWVGEGQGDDGRPNSERDAEGDSGLSGHGHPAGESHWSRSTEEDRNRR